MASVPLLPFLHPLLFPRSSSLRQLSRQIPQTIHHCRKATLTTATTASPHLAQPPQPLPESPRTSTPKIDPLPYHVHRTASQELPIYHLAKRGGNLHQTRIRKIQGDVDTLRAELQAELGLEKEKVVVNRLTGHIIVKGWFKEKIKAYLEERHL